MPESGIDPLPVRLPGMGAVALPPTSPDAVFDAHRPLLFSLAYRMLGSAMDAEDVVQECWLRWASADVEAVRSPRAFLVTAARNPVRGAERVARLLLGLVHKSAALGVEAAPTLVNGQPGAVLTLAGQAYAVLTADAGTTVGSTPSTSSSTPRS